MTRVNRVKSLRLAAVVAAAALVPVVLVSTHTSAASANAGLGPDPAPHLALPATGAARGPAKGEFIYTVESDVPDAVKKVETWASVNGTKNGAVRWTRCPMGGPILPTCLILLPKGHGPDALNDRTYTGIQQTLPTDPAILASYLQQHNSCDADPNNQLLAPNQAAFSELVMIINAIKVLPPGYGKLFFQAASKIKGTNVLAHIADAAGGSGTAVSMVESDARAYKAGRYWGKFELIFTPGTYQFLGLQQYSGPAAHGPWKLTSATSLRSYKFVKTAPHNYTGNASMGSADTCFLP